MWRFSPNEGPRIRVNAKPSRLYQNSSGQRALRMEFFKAEGRAARAAEQCADGSAVWNSILAEPAVLRESGGGRRAIAAGFHDVFQRLGDGADSFVRQRFIDRKAEDSVGQVLGLAQVISRG